MKPVFAFVLALALLTACQSKQAYTDNGNPGRINVIVFYDDNRNGAMDSGETGAPQIQMGISQDVSCPAQSKDKITTLPTDQNGTALFGDLKPGKYCVAEGPTENRTMTTKLTQDVYVSSDTTSTVMFGIVRDQ
jgi:uncharacterized protein (DUF2141 family)